MNSQRLSVVALLICLLSHSCYGATADKTQTSYSDIARTVSRYAIGAGALIGLAALQSVIESKLENYGPLAKTGQYIFSPLTTSIALMTLTPFQSWFGKYIHAALAPAEGSEQNQGDDVSLEGLWFKTYQTYSMNAQMSRNVVMALNTMTFLYLDRVQQLLAAGDLNAAYTTQNHFFLMTRKYYGEISFQSPIWEDVFVPHARLVWKDYCHDSVCIMKSNDFVEGAHELFFGKVLGCAQ